MNAYNYAYIHGFASSSLSRKGLYLREALRPLGADLQLPDLNHPSFEKLTYSDMLSVLDRFDRERPWRLIGSSMGGYISARWAELNPMMVDRLLLLCPGLNSADRWPEIIGREPYRLWEENGYHPIADAVGEIRPLHWDFVLDSREHPAFPIPDCPVRLIHGRSDDVVPLDLSRRYTGMLHEADLIEVEDDHSLAGSLDLVAREAISFFGLGR